MWMGVFRRLRRIPVWFLPDHQRLIQRVEAAPGLAVLSLPRNSHLPTLAVLLAKGEHVRDVARLLEARDDFINEELGDRRIGVAEHHVHVAARRLTPPIPAYDDVLEAAPDFVGVFHYRRRDPLDFGPRDLLLELLVVFDADLLRTCDLIPPELDDVVQVPPTAVVEVVGRLCADPPYVVKEQ